MLNKARPTIIYKTMLGAVGCIFFLTGCASYKYELASDPYKGYVVKRNDFLIPEYTTDTKNKAPQNLAVAQQRFKRRQSVVDDYYKKMGRIENQFKDLIFGYPLFLVTLVTAAFRLPFIAVSDYRYEHDPKYKAIIDKRDAELDKREEGIKDGLQKSLNKFIENDMTKETASETKTQPQAKTTN